MNKKESLRRQEIKKLIYVVIFTFFIGTIALLVFLLNNNTKYIEYSEKSDVDYKVLLKENEFYKEKYLEKGKSYIASLIDSVKTDFNYNISFNDDLDYNYSYKITADVDVDDENSDTTLYHFQENLVKKETKKASKENTIEESIDIDYNHYNNLINRFKDIYELRNAKSNLSISLYVTVETEEDERTILKDKKVSSIIIPLTQNTVNIDISNNTISNSSKKIVVSDKVDNIWLLLVACSFLVLSIIYIVYTILYIRRTRTAQNIYDKEIKSILNNYDSYIQKISGSYDIGTSQVIKIESFTDMLEIRDTLKQPILMLENEEKSGSFFIIPATNSIIYTYALRVIEIKAKMDGKEIPTYDITEIPNDKFYKNKKYTDEFIKDQITMTTAMPTVDVKNIIKGNTDKEKDLYDQLEMTRSFDVNEIRKAAKKTSKKNTKSKKNSKNK